MKKLLTAALVFSVILLFTLPVFAAQNVYLKGSGSSFSSRGWQNVFSMAEELGKYPNVWHLVYTKTFSDVTFMQLTFTNGEVFQWNPAMGPSVNSGGNNPGWVITAPYDWKIAYVSSGNNNSSESYLSTNDGSNVNFNVSGFNKGKPDDDDGGEDAAFSIQKYVDGTIFGEWASDRLEAGDLDFDELIEILGSIYFGAYAVEGDGADYLEENAYARGDLGLDGDITFVPGQFEPGWYAIVEYIEPNSKAAEIFDQVDPLYIQVGENNKPIGGEGDDFDYDAFYTIINGYGGGYVLGYPGLNNTGDIFFIGITNTATNQEYPSFCAEAGSRAFAGQSGMGCSGYVSADKNVLAGGQYENFLKAYNYIYQTYGDLDEVRPVTQIVSWILLGAIDVNSDEFENINWATVEAGTGAIRGVPGAKAKVEDVIANYPNYVGSHEIIDVVYLRCEYDHDTHDCQPQVAPIYGKTKFNNTSLVNLLGMTCFTKAKFGGIVDELAGENEFFFNLYKDVDGVWTLVGEYASNAIGMVVMDNLGLGSYKVVEKPHGVWTIEPQYAGGIFFDMVKMGSVLQAVWKKTYDDPVVVNVPKLGPSYGSVTGTNEGNRPAIQAGLNPKNGNPIFDSKAPEDPKKSTPFVVPNANHFVFAKLNRAELVEGVVLDMVVGNKFEIVGKALVKLVDGRIEITFNGKGDFGAIAFNKLPVFNNGNIHSQKAKDLEAFGAVKGVEFKHDKAASIPCPAGDTIYLYIHCSSIQFWDPSIPAW